MSRTRKSEESYRRFHQAEPRGWRKVKIPDLPERAWKLGKLVALVYEPEAPSSRAKAQYQHEFRDTGDMEIFWPKDYPLLYVSEDGKQLLIVRGKSQYYVDADRGIIG